jgi:D-glycerate 3-kinase
VEAGEQAVVLSLDDFYLPLEIRRELASKVHPLLRTRGVPGTHDVNALEETIGSLLSSGSEIVEWPKFSKAKDDRDGRNTYRTPALEWPLVVILEGWCVGCRELVDAASPANELERVEDPEQDWRHFVDMSLRSSYLSIWDKIDVFVFLEVPDWESVARWRTEQAVGNHEDLTKLNMRRFLQFFERITKQMLTTDGRRETDVLIKLKRDHKVEEMIFNRDKNL